MINITESRFYRAADLTQTLTLFVEDRHLSDLKDETRFAIEKAMNDRASLTKFLVSYKPLHDSFPLTIDCDGFSKFVQPILMSTERYQGLPFGQSYGLAMAVKHLARLSNEQHLSKNGKILPYSEICDPELSQIISDAPLLALSEALMQAFLEHGYYAIESNDAFFLDVEDVMKAQENFRSIATSLRFYGLSPAQINNVLSTDFTPSECNTMLREANLKTPNLGRPPKASEKKQEMIETALVAAQIEYLRDLDHGNKIDKANIIITLLHTIGGTEKCAMNPLFEYLQTNVEEGDDNPALNELRTEMYHWLVIPEQLERQRKATQDRRHIA